MEVLLIGGGIAGFYYWTLVRGRKNVRALIYMRLVHGDKLTPVEANEFVKRIGFMEATQYAAETKEFVASKFEGKQLPLINLAIQHGFIG